jgi:hypothetical protein
LDKIIIESIFSLSLGWLSPMVREKAAIAGSGKLSRPLEHTIKIMHFP